jgi:hypothetical protein
MSMDRQILQGMSMIDIVERILVSKSAYVVGEKEAESIAVVVLSLANEQVQQDSDTEVHGARRGTGGTSAAAMSRETSFLFMPVLIGI